MFRGSNWVFLLIATIFLFPVGLDGILHQHSLNDIFMSQQAVSAPAVVARGFEMIVAICWRLTQLSLVAQVIFWIANAVRWMGRRRIKNT